MPAKTSNGKSSEAARAALRRLRDGCSDPARLSARLSAMEDSSIDPAGPIGPSRTRLYGRPRALSTEAEAGARYRPAGRPRTPRPGLVRERLGAGGGARTSRGELAGL